MDAEKRTEIGEKMRKLRGIRTQVGIARELGISASAYRAYEYGERYPREKIRKRISKYFNVEESELFRA